MLLRITKICIFLKIFLIVKYFLLTKRKIKTENDSEQSFDEIYDEVSNTWRILNERNVSFLLSAPHCDDETEVLLLVSSGHDNVGARSRWRHALTTDHVRLVFLVSSCSHCHHDLVSEHDQHADIVTTSLEDGHRRLGYKILSGYIWAGTHCPQVRSTVKTDDNVVLDLSTLVSTLADHHVGDDVVVCGCGPPHRNMKTKRSEKPRMLGNWSAPEDQLGDDVVPDFCAGFMYLMTPATGSRLVQESVKMFGDYKDDVVLIEDMLITGVLRDSLGDVDLEMLPSTRLRWLWTQVLSHCPWLTVFKMTFFDELVIRKTSDRSGVQYVGSVTDLKVWKFFICLHVEVALINIDNLFGSVPDFLWDICQR